MTAAGNESVGDVLVDSDLSKTDKQADDTPADDAEGKDSRQAETDENVSAKQDQTPTDTDGK